MSEGLAAGEIVDVLGSPTETAPNLGPLRRVPRLDRGQDRAPQHPDPSAREAAARARSRAGAAPTKHRPRSSREQIERFCVATSCARSQAPRSSQRLVEIAQEPARRRGAATSSSGSAARRRPSTTRSPAVRRGPAADPQFAAIASELVKSIRDDLTVDWADRESSEAAIRRKIKRLLRQHKYAPPASPQRGRGATRQPLHAARARAGKGALPLLAGCRGQLFEYEPG